MRRILMTGATGFLGSHVLARLLAEPQKRTVTVLKRSFSNVTRIEHLLNDVKTFDLDKQELAEVFAFAEYDAILHCATNYGRSNLPQSEIVEANLLLPLRLLEMGLESGVKAFINTDTILDKNVSAYTLSKRQFREWLQSLSDCIVGVNVALEHFFGPGDDPTKFVSYVITKLLAEEPSIALTAGNQRRDFVYIEDVVEALLYILSHVEKDKRGYIEYEVGSGTSVSVREFVETVKTLSGNVRTHLDFGAAPFRRNEPMDIHVDVSRLQALGWSPRWSLQDALTETLRLERKNG